MIVYDFEIFKYDWLVCWLDTDTRKFHKIVNDRNKLRKFYEYYKNTIWIGYNSRNYDQWVCKAILCGFNPYEMSTWIIEKEQKGYAFSRLSNNYPINNYDCTVGFRSLKELEAFMGHDIRETTVPFDIDRKLTKEELEETIKYCMHDVKETFEVFCNTLEEFESHIGLIQEFRLGLKNISKTKAQLSAMILGASKPAIDRNDEFCLDIPDTLRLGQYEWIRHWYEHWAKNVKDYSQMSLDATINGVPHTFGIGGLHGAIKNYYGTGYYLMADVGSYYPAMMIEYNWLSRNVKDPSKYRTIRDERLVMKAKKDPRQKPRKIVLNSTFGASKDKYNQLYDPRMANNICVGGQLFLVDLLDKLDGKCDLIQSNTDGILLKLHRLEDKDKIIGICNEWCKRTRMEMEYDMYTKVIQRDVNNYILVDEKGNVKRKGAVVKKLSPLDNDLPIVNKAVVDYFVYGIPVETTVMGSENLIDFQKITKVSGKYDFAFLEHSGGRMFKFEKTVVDKKSISGYKRAIEEKYGTKMNEKVHRCFATIEQNCGALYKKHKGKTTLDKTAATPEHCRVINENVLDMPIPEWLDRGWYINLAKQKISEFLGNKC